MISHDVHPVDSVDTSCTGLPPASLRQCISKEGSQQILFSLRVTFPKLYNLSLPFLGVRKVLYCLEGKSFVLAVRWGVFVCVAFLFEGNQ